MDISLGRRHSEVLCFPSQFTQWVIPIEKPSPYGLHLAVPTTALGLRPLYRRLVVFLSPKRSCVRDSWPHSSDATLGDHERFLGILGAQDAEGPVVLDRIDSELAVGHIVVSAYHDEMPRKTFQLLSQIRDCHYLCQNIILSYYGLSIALMVDSGMFNVTAISRLG